MSLGRNVLEWMMSESMTFEELVDKCREEAKNKGAEFTIKKTKLGYKLTEGRGNRKSTIEIARF